MWLWIFQIQIWYTQQLRWFIDLRGLTAKLLLEQCTSLLGEKQTQSKGQTFSLIRGGKYNESTKGKNLNPKGW